MIFAISAMLLCQPGEPVTVENLITAALLNILAAVSLAWAYRRDTIVRRYKNWEYSRVTRRYGA